MYLPLVVDLRNGQTNRKRQRRGQRLGQELQWRPWALSVVAARSAPRETIGDTGMSNR